MADNTLQFETRVDLSGLNSGMSAAQSRVDGFATDVKTAMSQAQQATQQLADAQIQLGAAAEQGNASAAAVIREYQTQVDAANAAVARLSATESQEANVMRNSLSTRMLVTAEMRELGIATQGSGRLLSAFIAQFPALAAAAQAAFTGFALVAVGEIAVDVGKKLYDAFDLGGERARKFKDDLVDVEFQFDKTQSNLDVKLQKLIAERDKLEGKAPTNGLALDLAEATQRALELDSALVRANAERAKALGDNAPSLPQRILGTAGTGDEQKMLTQHNQNIKTATTAEAQLSEQRTYGIALTSQLNNLLQQQKDSDASARLAQQEGAVAFAEDYSKRIEAVKQLIQWKEQDDKLVSTTQKVDTAQNQVNALKGSDSGPKELAINRITQAIQAQEIADRAAAASHEAILRTWLEGYRAEQEEIKQLERADAQRTEMWKKNHAEQLQAQQAAAQATHDTNVEGIDTRQTTSANANQLSLVPDPEKQLNELRTFHAQAAAEDVRFIQEELGIYAEEPAKVDALEKKLAEVRRKADLQWLNDTKNISLQVAQAEQQALNKIENDIATTFSKSLTGQQSWAAASIKLYENVASSFIQNIVKMGEQELVALALHKSVMSSKILADAKGAAADSYEWASAWGGPIAGAIAAAGAFAGVLAFDSFEQGGIVGGGHGMPVPIMAHAGERVLTAGQTQKFESMVNSNNGGSATTTHLHYSPNINAFDRSGFRSTLQAHAGDIHDIVRQGMQSGSLKAR